MKKIISLSFVFASIALFAAPALADETAKPKSTPAVDQQKNEKGYGYEFKDDPLNAGVDGTNGFVITVRPKGLRSQLLRPRASFVQEMLKSVEAL